MAQQVTAVLYYLLPGTCTSTTYWYQHLSPYCGVITCMHTHSTFFYIIAVFYIRPTTLLYLSYVRQLLVPSSDWSSSTPWELSVVLQTQTHRDSCVSEREREHKDMTKVWWYNRGCNRVWRQSAAGVGRVHDEDRRGKWGNPHVINDISGAKWLFSKIELITLLNHDCTKCELDTKFGSDTGGNPQTMTESLRNEMHDVTHPNNIAEMVAGFGDKLEGQGELDDVKYMLECDWF